MEDFKTKWIPVKELRKLFPYWSESTFRQYKNLHKLPVPLTKMGGRWFCKVEDYNEYKQAHNITD